MQTGIVSVSGGGGYPPGGGGPPGGWGPPPGAPPGGGGYGPPGGAPPGGYGPPGGPPPGGYAPPGGGPPGGPPPGGYGPPGGGPPGAPPGGYGPPGGAPPGGAPPGGYGPPGGGPPPGAPPGGGGYGPPGGPPPGGSPPGGYGPPGGGYGGPPGGGYGGPPGGAPPGGYGPPGSPPGWGGPPGAGGPPGGYPGAFAPPGMPGGPTGTSWTAMEAFGFAWNAIMKNFAGVALPIFVGVLVIGLPTYVISFALGLMMPLVAEYVDPSFLGIFGGVLQVIISLIAVFVSAFVMGGIVEVALRTARGERTDFSVVFSGGKYFGAMLVGSLGCYVAVVIGMVLCIVPGVIVALGLMPFTFVIVDEKLGGIDALKRAWELTRGHKMGLFIYGLLGILVYIAGILACFIGVWLVSVPMLLVGQGYIYLRLKGEQPRLPA